MSKILIVEDDKLVSNIYRNRLCVEGYQVEAAADGETGLNLVHGFQPDAVILDLMLPKMTGVELMKRIRAEPRTQRLPVIVLSNTYLTNFVQEAWKAGATRCLPKAHCTPKQLADILGQVLANDRTPAGPPAPAAHTPPPTSAAAVAHGLQSDQGYSGNDDGAFQADLRKTLITDLPGTLTALRASLHPALQSDSEAVRVKVVREMSRRVKALTACAALAGMPLLAQMSDALGALLKELAEKPKTIAPSTLRTVAATIDLLGVLHQQDLPSDHRDARPVLALVVDDETISRHAITYALQKAALRSLSVESPSAAYELLLDRDFDLIILDADMPGMNGFEVSAKLRQFPRYKTIPIVFVSSQTNLESRAHSAVSGANDFIAKPFLFMELAVKALALVLKERLARRAPAGSTT